MLPENMDTFGHLFKGPKGEAMNLIKRTEAEKLAKALRRITELETRVKFLTREEKRLINDCAERISNLEHIIDELILVNAGIITSDRKPSEELKEIH